MFTCALNSNNIILVWIGSAISSTVAWDCLIMCTVSDMRLTASAIEAAQCKRNSFRATAICAAVPCKRWGAGEAQHFADNVGSLDVPGCTSITPFSTDWLAVVIDVSAINACVGSFQCNGTCNGIFHQQGSSQSSFNMVSASHCLTRADYDRMKGILPQKKFIAQTSYFG